MALPFPYVFYACPCTDPTAVVDIHLAGPDRSHLAGPDPARSAPPTLPGVSNSDDNDHDHNDDHDDSPDSRPFDPRARRANFALYPLDYLLYCVDCHEMRCRRCTRDEANTWFCPFCQLEVAGKRVKGDLHRCVQNCFNCPICSARLGVGSVGPQFYLSCPYCHWSSLEIGVRFDKPVNIASQLSRHRRSSTTGSSDQFDSVINFYRSQLKQSDTGGSLHPGLSDFGSPSSLSRLISYYSTPTTRKGRTSKPTLIRESHSRSEGLIPFDDAAEAAAISKLQTSTWDDIASITQRTNQTHPNTRLVSDLWPVPPLLRTKRSKRCRRCRQILLKPETKISTTRCKIKLLALNHVPKLLVAPLTPASGNGTGSSVPSTPSSRPVSITSVSALVPSSGNNNNNGNNNHFALVTGTTAYFVLTVSNPLDDPISVHLAAPSSVPGFVHSRVTIMRPQFDVGANADAWDDVLESSAGTGGGTSTGTGGTGGSSGNGDGQSRTHASTGSVSTSSPQLGIVSDAVLAGEIWNKGRNWTSVVVEVAIGYPDPDTEKGNDNGVDTVAATSASDRLVVEIPIFVRTEYETASLDEHDDDAGHHHHHHHSHHHPSDSARHRRRRSGVEEHARLAGPAAKVRREHAFWTVVGVGRVIA